MMASTLMELLSHFFLRHGSGLHLPLCNLYTAVYKAASSSLIAVVS